MARDFEYSDSADQDAKRARTAAKALRDILRKTFAQSGDARQTTEEILRAVLGDVKIPREYANVIFQQLNATRSELVRVIAGEVRTFLDEANLGEELAKILTSLSFEIRTEIRFIPNDEALRPSVKSRVGIKSARSTAKTAARKNYDPHINDEEDDLVETPGSAAIDKAIQSRIASLANVFLKGIIDIDDDEDEQSRAWEDDNDADEPPTTEAAQGHAHAHEDTDSDHTDDGHKRSGFNPLNPRDYRMRVSLSPDIRRRAEAAASQVATAGRVTASLSAATAASAVSAAANRAQAVVRSSRNLTSPDAREAMWKKWVSPEEPDLVGNPVIGAPLDFGPAEGSRKPSQTIRSRHDQPQTSASAQHRTSVDTSPTASSPVTTDEKTVATKTDSEPQPSAKPSPSSAASTAPSAEKTASPAPSKAEATEKAKAQKSPETSPQSVAATPKPKAKTPGASTKAKTTSVSTKAKTTSVSTKAKTSSTSAQTSASAKKTTAKTGAAATKKTGQAAEKTSKTTARPKTTSPAKKHD